MKSPPQQYTDDEARRLMEAFIRTHALPTAEATPTAAPVAVEAD
jgi:hypothetical protein